MRKFPFGRRNGRGFGLDSHDVAVSSAIVAVTLIAAILIVALVDHQDPGGGPAGGGPVAVPSATDIPTPPRTSAPSTRTATTTPSASASPTSTDPASQPPAEPARTESASPTSSPSTPPNLPLRPEVTILNNSRVKLLAEKSAPVVVREGFLVRETGNYLGEITFAHSVIFYQEGQDAAAEILAAALRKYEKEIELRLNKGEPRSPNGTLILVVTKHFKIDG
ncbi:LytR_C domain-containing protein [Frankia sp. Hr75.2]|nr:LytR_C domain-containing protein [Frankia sp. Hr75.2]